MPGFDNHREAAATWAAVAGTTAGPPLYLATTSLEWTAAAMVLTTACAYLGGLLPDMDSYSSVPRRWLNRTVVAIIDLTIAIVIISNWSVITIPFTLRSGGLLVVVLTLGAMSGWVDDAVQRLMPDHRQELHDLHVWIVLGTVFGIVTTLIVEGEIGTSAGVVFGAFAAGGLIGGIFTHLTLDDELPGE